MSAAPEVIARRSYTRVYRDIWLDRDWRGLSARAQGTYMMLLTSPSITLAGTMPLQIVKWSRMSAEQDTDAVEDSLWELREHGFIVVDQDTEELLVRAFMRNDTLRNYKSSRTQLGIVRQARKAESLAIRHALADEMERCIGMFVVTEDNDVRALAMEAIDLLRKSEPVSKDIWEPEPESVFERVSQQDPWGDL